MTKFVNKMSTGLSTYAICVLDTQIYLYVLLTQKYLDVLPSQVDKPENILSTDIDYKDRHFRRKNQTFLLEN